MSYLKQALGAAALCVAAAVTPAHAQTTVTVTGDGSRVTVPAGGATVNQPLANDTWALRNVRETTAAGITTAYARSGNGSAHFTGGSANAKADFELTLSQPFALSQLSGLSYDWFRAGTSTNDAKQVPAIRLLVANFTNGVPTTGGFLVYEPYYTNGLGTQPVDGWVTETIGATSNLWFRKSFPAPGATEEVFGRSLEAYQTGTYTPTAGFPQIDGNTLVYGLSFGVGSGWTGAYDMAVDNVRLTTTGATARDVQWNFEVQSTVPEPGTYALVGSGLAMVAGLARRRRRSA